MSMNIDTELATSYFYLDFSWQLAICSVGVLSADWVLRKCPQMQDVQELLGKLS